MFLSRFFENEYGRTFNKLARESSTFNASYVYWREQLFERIMRLFVWENTFDITTGQGVKPKEIEQRLLISGYCAVTKINNEEELTAMYGSFFGVTKYYDEYPNFNVRSPIYSGKRTIGKDVVIINNTTIRNAALPLVHHYAILLGHTDVTLVNCLVNARDAGGVPIAGTEKQKQSILDYLGKLFNGQYGVVTDIGNIGIEYAGADRRTQQGLLDILEARQKLLKSFYADIGVRSAFEKRNNSVTAEVEADTSLLLLNLSDMIQQRETGAEEVNKMFGANWQVHIAKEIDYGMENEEKEVTEDETED